MAPNEPNILVNGGFDLPASAVTADRWSIRCRRCGGPFDGYGRLVLRPDPVLGGVQELYCRACVTADPACGTEPHQPV